MATTLSRNELALLEKLGLSTTDVEKAQKSRARSERTEKIAEVFAKHENALREFAADLMAAAPAEPSAKSAWTGTTGTIDIGGLGIKVLVTDKAASDARKAEFETKAS